MREKSRKADVDEEGRLLIPADLRAQLGIEPNTVLFLMMRGDQIIMSREQEDLDATGTFWQEMSHRSLERLWDEEDEAWEKYCGEDTA